MGVVLLTGCPLRGHSNLCLDTLACLKVSLQSQGDQIASLFMCPVVDCRFEVGTMALRRT